MDSRIQPMPGERMPPEPKRRESARRRGKGEGEGRPFELPAQPPREENTPTTEKHAPAPPHVDGVGLRIDVTA